jgi:hypothetical protein
MLAATYAEAGRDQDALREKAIIAHLPPFFDDQTSSQQFGTRAACGHMLEGLRKPASVSPGPTRRAKPGVARGPAGLPW